jgi:hypothetical protein
MRVAAVFLGQRHRPVKRLSGECSGDDMRAGRCRGVSPIFPADTQVRAVEFSPCSWGARPGWRFRGWPENGWMPAKMAKRPPKSRSLSPHHHHLSSRGRKFDDVYIDRRSPGPLGRPETPRPRASPSPARRPPFCGGRPGVRASRHRRGARRPRGGPGDRRYVTVITVIST